MAFSPDEIKNNLRTRFSRGSPGALLDVAIEALNKYRDTGNIGYLLATSDTTNPKATMSEYLAQILLNPEGSRSKRNPITDEGWEKITRETGYTKGDVSKLKEERDSHAKGRLEKGPEAKAQATAEKMKKFEEYDKWITKKAKTSTNPRQLLKEFNKKFPDNLLTDPNQIWHVRKGKFGQLPKRHSLFPENSIFVELFDKPLLNTKDAPLNVMRTAIYHLNSEVQEELINKIDDIASHSRYRVRAERQAAFNNPLFRAFGINESIRGPFRELLVKSVSAELLKELGEQKRAGGFDQVVEVLEWIKKNTDPNIKTKEIDDVVKAIKDFRQDKLPRYQAYHKIDNVVNMEHRITKSLMEKGYAPWRSYLDMVPTSQYFNLKQKLPNYDRKIASLADKFSKADEAGDTKLKGKLVKEMKELTAKFSKDTKGYLDAVNINYKNGKLTFTADTDIVRNADDLEHRYYRWAVDQGLMDEGRLVEYSPKEKFEVIKNKFRNPVERTRATKFLATAGDVDKVDLNKLIDKPLQSKAWQRLKLFGHGAGAIAAGATLPITYFGAHERGLSPWDILTTGTARLGEDIYNMLPLGKDVVDWASQYTLPAFLSGEDRKGFLEFMDRDREERGIGYSTRGQEFQAETLADYTPGELKKNITENFDPILHLGLKEGEGKFPSIEGTWFGFDGKGEKYDNLLQERIDQTLAERDYWQAKRLYENNPEMARAILEDYETTGFGNRETYNILQDMFKSNYAGGGITTLDPLKPWALPPEAGPDPRGQKIKEGIEYLVK